ncbi:MAG: UDP-N-acetylmuramoyl-L-alanine--D-glutamate ligase [Pseudomonadota bacterium]
MNYCDRHVLVLGLGESGLAMALWLVRCGARVRVADTRAAPPALASLQAQAPMVEFTHGPFDASLLDGVELVAVSPGLSPLRELVAITAATEQNGTAMIGEIELFAQALRALHVERAYAPKVLAITGTNGKTTVTRMAGLLCERSGLRTQVAGNISPAALDVLRRALDDAADDLDTQTLPQVWVLELSSFQLQHTYTLNADAAALLNITQDHLDWHGDMAAYTEAKMRVFGGSTIRVLNRDDVAVITAALPAQKTVDVVTFGSDEAQAVDCFGLSSENGMAWLSVAVAAEDESENKRTEKKRRKNSVAMPVAVRTSRLMPADALQVRGRHNAVNALAALALCRAIDLPLAPLLHALRNYRGEPHRVELVTTIAGVRYFDDSKGTNVGATVAALIGLGIQTGHVQETSKKLWLILGGEGKNQDFSPLNDAIRRYVRAVLLIGRDAPQIRVALAAAGTELIDFATLEAAVQYAAEHADDGDSVLLSPACASFDMFRDYQHRAQVFVASVREAALARGELMA